MDTLQAGIEKSELIFSMKSVVLSTIDEFGNPYASYAPFGVYHGDYYLIVSNSARHTQHVRRFNKAGLLWVEDESKAQSVFFRKRFYLETEVTLDVLDQGVIDMMKSRFKDTFTTLMLMDFTIIKCVGLNGQLILGPGLAFDQIGKELFPAKNGGHRSTKA